MSVDEIKKAIIAMTPAERSRIRDLLEKMAKADSDAWDKQIEQDALSGKLDKLIGESLRDYRAGHFRKL
jgi:hypothetical protein